MSNGSNGCEELAEVFKGCNYTFRHFPDATVEMMRWQCGRCELIESRHHVSGCRTLRIRLHC
jgi:hypothetical protein